MMKRVCFDGISDGHREMVACLDGWMDGWMQKGGYGQVIPCLLVCFSLFSLHLDGH